MNNRFAIMLTILYVFPGCVTATAELADGTVVRGKLLRSSDESITVRVSRKAAQPEVADTCAEGCVRIRARNQLLTVPKDEVLTYTAYNRAALGTAIASTLVAAVGGAVYGADSTSSSPPKQCQLFELFCNRDPIPASDVGIGLMVVGGISALVSWSVFGASYESASEPQLRVGPAGLSGTF